MNLRILIRLEPFWSIAVAAPVAAQSEAELHVKIRVELEPGDGQDRTRRAWSSHVSHRTDPTRPRPRLNSSRPLETGTGSRGRPRSAFSGTAKVELVARSSDPATSFNQSASTTP